MFSKLPRDMILILRTLWKHTNISTLDTEYDIVELKIVRPVKILELEGEHRPDIAIFMSSIAVKFTENIKIYAKYVIPVGEDTKREIEESRNIAYEQIVLPEQYSSIGIVKTLEELVRSNKSIRNVYVYRSAHGSRIIWEKCRELSVEVEEFRIYRLEPIEYMLKILPDMIEYSRIIVAMSGYILEIAYRYLSRIGKKNLLNSRKIVVPGPEAARKATELGIERIYMANNADTKSIFQLIDRIIREDGEHDKTTYGASV